MIKSFAFVTLALFASSVAFGSTGLEEYKKGQRPQPTYSGAVKSPLESSLTFTIPPGGVETFDGPGSSPPNIRFPLDLGAAAGTPGADMTITDVAWDVEFMPMGLSWYSEGSFAIIDSDFDTSTPELTTSAGVTLGYGWSPGAGDPVTTSDGTFHAYAGGSDLSVDFADGDLTVLGGVATLEFYEGYDDVPGAADGLFAEGGTITFTVMKIPEPSSLGLMSLSLIGLLGFRRR